MILSGGVKTMPLFDGSIAVRNDMLHGNPDGQVGELEQGIMYMVPVMLLLATVAHCALFYPGSLAFPLAMKE
jgi:hypothetical protein